MIRAYRTLDCAKKVRVHYLLPAAVDRALLGLFPGAEVTVQEFSRLVAGAKDHFVVTRGDTLRAAGVLGESRVVVTYGKNHEQWPGQDISYFEEHLRRGGFGDIEYQEQRPAE